MMLFIGALSYDCASDANSTSPESCSTPSVVYYGLATFAAGAGMAATGFVLYGTNRTGFHFQTEPAPPRFTARVRPVPLPHGGVGLGTIFSC
jgi:hypothetical protein